MKHIEVKKKQNLTSQIKSIIKGTVNLIQNNNRELAEARKLVCKSCPLYKATSESIHVCNSDLKTEVQEWLGDLGINKVNGCACIIESKSTVVGEGNTCPALKWNDIDYKYLALLYTEYNSLEDEEKSMLLNNIKNIGLVMGAYTHKIRVVRRLISHNQLELLGYRYILNNEDLNLTYTKSNIKLVTYIDGTYQLYVDDKIKISKDNSLSFNIDELLNIINI